MSLMSKKYLLLFFLPLLTMCTSADKSAETDDWLALEVTGNVVIRQWGRPDSVERYGEDNEISDYVRWHYNRHQTCITLHCDPSEWNYMVSAIQREGEPLIGEEPAEEDLKSHRNTCMIDIRPRNILDLKLKADDVMELNGAICPITMLKDSVKLFIANPDNDMHLSEKYVGWHNDTTECEISMGCVWVVDEADVSDDFFAQVSRLLTEAFDELRDEYTRTHFGRPYREASPCQKSQANFCIPYAIMYCVYSPGYGPDTPPPPPSD